MPKLEQPVKLENLCLRTTTTMLRRLRNLHHPEDFAWFSEDKNPIAYLPHPVIQKLISELSSLVRPMSKHIMRVLLCSNMRMHHLDLSRIEMAEPAGIIRMLHPISNHLRTLQLPKSHKSYHERRENKNLFAIVLWTSRTDVVKLIGSLVNVTHLELHEFGFDDALDAVGEGCPQLKVLQTSCEHVTDDGWRRLCVDPVSGRPRGQKLQKISISACAYSKSFTPEGLLFVLRHLPCLVEFENCKVGELLVRAHEKDFETTDVTYPLRHLIQPSREQDPCPSLMADIVLRTCPYLTTLNLDGPNDDALVKFGRLRNLVDVTVIANPEVMSFDGGLLPFLRQAGTNLTKFTIKRIDKLDLGAIDYFCPKLTYFDCLIQGEIVDGDLKNTVSFKKLQKLVFALGKKFLFNLRCVEHLRMLLNYCLDLKRLTLLNCNHLTDQVLMAILRVNPLKRLEYVNFRYMDELSLDGLRMLIDRESELRSMDLFDCTEKYALLIQQLCDQYQGCNLDLVVNNIKIYDLDTLIKAYYALGYRP